MTDTTTARRALYLALMTDGVTGRGHSPDRSEQATALIEAFRDEDRARHRKEVLTEGHVLITSASLARLEEIDEDDRRPSHWERHQEWCDAADLLLAARTTTAKPSTKSHCTCGEGDSTWHLSNCRLYTDQLLKPTTAQES